MYVHTYVTLTDILGNENDYQVGAEVDHDPGGNGWAPEYSVGEPDISAADGKLATSRILSDELLQQGWSDTVEEALILAYSEDDSADCLRCDADEERDNHNRMFEDMYDNLTPNPGD